MKMMVPLSGDELHQIFDILADWNHQLEHFDGLAEALAACDVEHGLEEEPEMAAPVAEGDLAEPAP